MSAPVAGNIDRFSGFADCYDKYRPAPPAVIVDILSQLAQVSRPAMVVDLGCGTGLSTRLWLGHADRIVGVEPNADMRRQAAASTAGLVGADAVEYRQGTSSQTGLPDGCADVVTCSQSFHWMEPTATLAEVARVLRVGGVFAVYDCDWPPTMVWQAQAAYRAFTERTDELEQHHGVEAQVRKWPKSEHLANIRNSGHFRFTSEILMHQVEEGSAQRLVGLASSFGGVATLLKQGLTPADVGLEELKAALDRILGGQTMKWYFSYRMRIGVK